MGAIELPFSVPAEVLERAAKLKLVVFDVDGVLTDASLFLGDDGQEYKAFNSRDGHGIKMLRRSGVEVGIITARTSQVVRHRAADLGITHVHQGAQDKLPTYRNLLAELKLSEHEVAYVGDDVVDLPIMLRAGLAVAVQDAHALVQKHAHWSTPSVGGRGAARDVCEMIMFSQGNYADQMRRFLD